MIFNSFQFILLFLPLCYAGFVLVHRGLGWEATYAYLFVASIVFYAQFHIVLAIVLLGSITFNFLVGRLLIVVEDRNTANTLLGSSIVANLGALAYFKYTNFFIDIVNDVSGAGYSHLEILLPVGVSFFTFTQIGYLVEAAAGRTGKESYARYGLFAGFFPCVTAGPLLLQREIFDQMQDRADPAFSPNRVAVGLTMFGIGLAKKVIIADSIATYSDAVFDGVAAGYAITTMEAWIGALCYALQLYFDFSGYSDMAIGIAFLFGFRLPLNFNSPFKATSISDFWNRWHMTMTRFFTTFIYTQLAMRGARHALTGKYGRFRKWVAAGATPIFYTFVIAGIWHGAGWTFVLYGLIHGIALAVNHGWRELSLPQPPAVLGWAMTMLVVVVGLVVFRASDIATASAMLLSMLGISDFAIAAAAEEVVEFDVQSALFGIAIGTLIVLAMPNSQEILRKQWISCNQIPENIEKSRGWIQWSPTATWATAIGVLIVIAATSLNDSSGFLYYDF